MQGAFLPDLRQRLSPYFSSKDESATGLFQPFGKPTLGPVACFVNELRPVLRESKAKHILWFLVGNALCSVVLFYWSRTSDSLALAALAQLTLFDLLCLGNCLLGLWVSQHRAAPSFSFGCRRWEVLSLFAITMLAQLGAFLLLKESLMRLVQQPVVHTGLVLPGLLVALCCHLAVQLGVEHPSLGRVLTACSSSWLQEHMADLSHGVCRLVPGLSSLLLPRLNPLLLLGWAGALVVLVAHSLVGAYGWQRADTVGAAMLAAMACATMLPMGMHCAFILLQTTPGPLLGQLDKCLREASTLDGVLEFRHEQFWSLSLGSLAGSVHVRVRRDADEQLVLAHIVDRLSGLVPELTVQVFKDEWAWSSSPFSASQTGDRTPDRPGASVTAPLPGSTINL
ncbi:zinc transporter 6 [Ixodes scapularis]